MARLNNKSPNVFRISVANSSTATLGGGAAFTGVSEDVAEFDKARVITFSDQASATDGLQIQQSSDGTNWDYETTATVSASTADVQDITLYGQYFRIVYTNGATPQGSFRLQVIFKR